MNHSLNDLRSAFLDYFNRQGHEIRPSGSLVPQNDPTLMFANAGMNQFKNVFTGAEKLPYSRATTAQKCVRAGGKHNDLDNVGYTARHHTFFEMLGNFSFGDYFKEEAIQFGWEFLTKEMGINPEKLCVTVYHDDDFAWNHWKKITGFADHKIIRIDTADNFWSMGDTGPCGPCSEIFYDHGDKIAGGPPGTADADGDRFIEIWNLVFMQYEQLADGTRVDLPKPSIDTGMGLERITAVLQGVHDNYDIDLFKSIIQKSEHEAALLGSRDQLNVKDKGTAHRVLADHLRSACFLIADGVMPSNEGRGYVLRRIMRRAMRYAHQLGCADPLMHRLVPNFVALMGEQYPELTRAEAMITENLRSEEERFKQTLERGLKLLDDETTEISKGAALKGDVAFKLYDTYGFPLDLTQDILRSRGISVDTEGFDACMEQQKEMARAAHKGSGDTATGKIWFALKEKLGSTEFVGYDADECEATILAIVKDGAEVTAANVGDEVSIILNRTPFYGESGGQVGDVGRFSSVADSKALVAEIVDTKKPIEDMHVHKAMLKAPIRVGDKITARITSDARNATRANHSATHLLHKALRDLLGEHVTQKGSLVDPDRLRFDFSHGKAVTREEIAAVEKKVNDVVWKNTDVTCKVMTPDDAIAAGAMALFGEKYGDEVRVLSMGEDAGNTYSVELCGGTHVRNTSEIGVFKITSEGSVASGIRRVEAVTSEGVRKYYLEIIAKQSEQLQTLLNTQHNLLDNLVGLISKETQSSAFGRKYKLPEVSVDALQKASFSELNKLFEDANTEQMEAMLLLQEANKELTKQLAEEKKKQALAAIGDVQKEMIGTTGFIAQHVEGLPAKELRPLAETLLKQAEPGVVIAVATDEGKASVVIAVSSSLVGQYNAVDLIKIAVEKLGGKGGGGKPDFAQGGGPDANAVDTAIAAVKNAL